MENQTYNDIFDKIKKGDEQAFKILFHTFYKSLCNYAIQFLEDIEDAEEVSQDIFVKLWEKRSTIEIKTSVKNYLFRSVRNQCLNQIKHKKIKQQYVNTIKEISKQDINISHYFIEPDLAKKIGKAINLMPEKRKNIFRLSREEGLKYKEIAKKLNISEKTVEAHMGLALKYLRKKLKIYYQNTIDR